MVMTTKQTQPGAEPRTIIVSSEETVSPTRGHTGGMFEQIVRNVSRVFPGRVPRSVETDSKIDRETGVATTASNGRDQVAIGVWTDE